MWEKGENRGGKKGGKGAGDRGVVGAGEGKNRKKWEKGGVGDVGRGG